MAFNRRIGGVNGPRPQPESSLSLGHQPLIWAIVGRLLRGPWAPRRFRGASGPAGLWRAPRRTTQAARRSSAASEHAPAVGREPFGLVPLSPAGSTGLGWRDGVR